MPSETQALWSNHIDKDHIVNKSDSGSELLLGLSREVGFVRDCIDIITSEVHNLRTEIILPPKKLAKKAEPHDKPTTDILGVSSCIVLVKSPSYMSPPLCCNYYIC